MDSIIQKLKAISDWQVKFQYFNHENHIENNPTSRFQMQNIQSLKKHLQKISQQCKDKHRISWVSSEYQVLEMVLNALSVITEKKIEDFKHQQWDQIYSIFPYKLPLTIKYQSLRLIIQKKQPRRRWCSQQQNFLIEIVRKLYKKNKWNDVARQLFIRSNALYFRQGKHCRQRWLNHLHPSIQNNGWSLSEDIKLLTFILKKGKKWARLAKKFDMKRTECMVKKRFYQLIQIEQNDAFSVESLKQHIKNALMRLSKEQASQDAQKIQSKHSQEKQNKKIEQISWGKVKQAQVKNYIPGLNFTNQKAIEYQNQMQLNRISAPVDFQLPPGSVNLKEIYDNPEYTYPLIQNSYIPYVDQLQNYQQPSYIQYPQYFIPLQNHGMIHYYFNQY